MRSFELLKNQNVRKWTKWGGVGFILIFFAWVVLSRAWYTDDAYFTYRTVDNFVNGYGLTWNVVERVQGYTHPLWMFLVSAAYYFTREIYFTPIVLSLLLSLAVAATMLLRLGGKWRHGAAGVFLLSISTAFIDYSTSGLANPLTHLLLIIFLYLFLLKPDLPKRLFWLSLLAALASVNRLDTILFYLPALLYEWAQDQNKLRALGTIAVGFLPLVLWEAFSIIYYGSPFPGTYYAKAHNYVPLHEELWAGLNYFLFSVRFDPITWAVILGGLATAFWSRRHRAAAVAVGMVLYLVYVLQIGGDFMGGRFLTAAYLSGVALLVVYVMPRFSGLVVATGLALSLVISFLGSSPPYLLYAKDFETARWNGVVDERMVFFQTTLLRIEDLYAFNSDPDHNWLNKAAYLARGIYRGTLIRQEAEHDWVDLGREQRDLASQHGYVVLPQGATGFSGFYSGPDVYLINTLALTDPFLMRIPPIFRANWRSGHFMRIIPEGYIEVQGGGGDHLGDPQLDHYYQQIRLVTEGAIFSADRWRAIWDLNVLEFDDWAPGLTTSLRFPWMVYADAGEAARMLEDATSSLEFGYIGSGVQIHFDEPPNSCWVEIRMSAGDNFEIAYIDPEGQLIGSQILLGTGELGMQLYTLEMDTQICEASFAAIRIIPTRVFYDEADGEYSFGGMRIVEDSPY